MRLWSIHPCYLDAKGLVALWREGLLAQSVLLGKTKGYTNHPQLLRFKSVANPAGAIASYLRCVAEEAEKRGYSFNRSKIGRRYIKTRMPVTDGQVAYEFQHLLGKLEKREPALFDRCKDTTEIDLHPLFFQVNGDIETWEKRS